MRDVRLTEGAEEDYTESLCWYANRSTYAAEGFQSEFERALGAISANAQRYPHCDNRHQFYLLTRYPYLIIYRQESENACLIVAVAHAKRSPGYWQNR